MSSTSSPVTTASQSASVPAAGATKSAPRLRTPRKHSPGAASAVCC